MADQLYFCSHCGDFVSRATYYRHLRMRRHPSPASISTSDSEVCSTTNNSLFSSYYTVLCEIVIAYYFSYIFIVTNLAICMQPAIWLAWSTTNYFPHNSAISTLRNTVGVWNVTDLMWSWCHFVIASKLTYCYVAYRRRQSLYKTNSKFSFVIIHMYRRPIWKRSGLQNDP